MISCDPNLRHVACEQNFNPDVVETVIVLVNEVNTVTADFADPFVAGNN